MIPKTLCALIACLSDVSAVQAEIPSDCSAATSVSVMEGNEAFSQRSVRIIGFAQRGDISILASLVAPSAQFTIWEGDVAVGKKHGVTGAVEFAKRIQAAAYDYAAVVTGPLSTDICGLQTVTIWLKRADGEHAYVADFKYNKGVLIEAVATTASISKGSIPSGA